jgi:UTP--glucose-1-phosphate uridylyltransferase
MIAILPAGGRGIRMSKVTGGRSKEALPLGGQTILDHALDEAFEAGVERAVVVSAREKLDIEAIVKSRKQRVDIRYQEETRGLADAIVSAREFEDDALILLPDTVFAPSSAPGVLAEMGPHFDGAILAQRVTDEQIGSYGILECTNRSVTRILEKPSRDATSSRLAIAARFYLSARVLRVLKEFVESPISHGEYDLTSGLNRALAQGMNLIAVETDARRFDCGSPDGYREALEQFGK